MTRLNEEEEADRLAMFAKAFYDSFDGSIVLDDFIEALYRRLNVGLVEGSEYITVVSKVPVDLVKEVYDGSCISQQE